ncbi:FAD-dependent oxidoreductase [Devosia sp.]|uniref:FAD-dependent oxidoreductase n=1 Tax=Devosia sp. TaxID=1871048 RepID=UPI0032673CD6
MKYQPHRLGVETPHLLGGSAIDRARPLRFKLNGRTIHGFAGDTVLSAALAAGIKAIGTYRGEALALSERFSPSVLDLGFAGAAAQTLPMARTPAVDGAELRTQGSASGRDLFDTMAHRRSQTLGLKLDPGHRLVQPWLDGPSEGHTDYDLIVVGGGVAGMNAAIAAGKAGSAVVVVERQASLGGEGALFGTMEGEETPAESVARPIAEIAALPNITILLRAEAISIRAGRVQVHQVQLQGSRPIGKILTLVSKAVVLATGSLERLPVFPGNRLPGVIGVTEAFERARRYGVWTGASAVLSTVAGAPYRLAMQASDAGIKVLRIADTRPRPQSRFIEFAKAYGITQASGMAPARASSAGKAGLSITLQLAFEGYHSDEPAIVADQFIVCGGWQPELSPWHAGGGSSQWNAENHRIEAAAGPAGVVLAGAAAGWFSKQACQQSGVDAVNLLFKRKRKAIHEKRIDPIYETLDDPTPITQGKGSLSSYLDAGQSLIALPPATTSRWPFRRPEPWSLAQQPQAFGICDIAAGVQLGAIEPAHAGTIAMERTTSSMDLISLIPTSRSPADAPAAIVPPYLAGRFGARPQLWVIAANEARALDVGSLIYLNSDGHDPRLAIGAVVSTDAEAVVALIGKDDCKPGDGITVNDQGRSIAARITARFDATNSAAALGSGAGPL